MFNLKLTPIHKMIRCIHELNEFKLCYFLRPLAPYVDRNLRLRLLHDETHTCKWLQPQQIRTVALTNRAGIGARYGNELNSDLLTQNLCTCQVQA